MSEGVHAKVIRIVCPSCQAAYEVPQAAISAGGRDVQCSACGHNWFQLWLPGPAAPESPAAASGTADKSAAPRASERPPEAAGAETGWGFAEGPQAPLEGGPPLPSVLAGRARRAVPPRPPAAGMQPPAAPPLEEEPELDLPFPPRRKLDPGVLAVLKEEAETEARARRRDAGMPLESQDELPLAPRPRRSPGEVRDRLARLQQAERSSGESAMRWRPSGENPGNEPDPEAEAPLDPPQGGFRPMPPLSDNEPAPDLSSLLSDRAGMAPSPPPERPAQVPVPREIRSGLPVAARSRALAQVEAAEVRRGFRIGFLTPVAAALILLAAYLAAPALSRHLPVAAPALERVIAGGDAVQERLARGILGMFGQDGRADGS
ncbi:zinc-ribbon domain-containing protein [Mangrovicoccus sp. HB161399]|uniref:zinc-ribbon domain-containing protein n=1 Tax=Mangrovicoccus sp. HB161399 TaxID=2720392 RepID=UPI001C12FD72|nr:zinc-ribbon domain-containing protein [Mangrovicoccus sp. HB161399]